MPRRTGVSGRLENSVCRSTHLNAEGVWAICSEHFDTHAPSPAIGRGVGQASAIYAEGLSFDPDGKPYPEHANIIGWLEVAGMADNQLKHAWMAQAQRISLRFGYRVRPN